MLKKFYLLLCFLLLSNCVSQSTSLIGPVITGARTGSIYQASLSFGSGKLMNDFKKTEFYKNHQIISSNYIIYNEEPMILTSYVVHNIVISDVFEPEPLP